MSARAAIALLVVLPLLAGGARAQDGEPSPEPLPAGELVAAPAAEAATFGVHHSFPLAGGTLVVVFDGMEPGEPVLLALANPTGAPPSVLELLQDPAAAQRSSRLPASTIERHLSAWVADDLGRLTFSFLLDDPADAGRGIGLKLTASQVARQSPELRLLVQPPTVVVPAADGLLRVDLLSGALLLPSIPGEGGLAGMAFSGNGLRAHLLREDGRLELRSAASWEELLAERLFDDAPDTLAASAAGGAAFLLSRPAGEPLAPGATLHFVDETRAPLLLEPMAQAVAGRRAVLTDDGLTAFVAEDDRLVREVDLLTGEPGALIAAGLPGDVAIADLALVERRLHVLTRGVAGRRGALTVYDLDAGAARTLPLDIDPLRLVQLGERRLLVVPAAGALLQVIDNGVPRRVPKSIGQCLDAAPAEGGALLLVRQPSGVLSVTRYDLEQDVETMLLWRSPPAERIVAHRQGVAVLLGDPSGAVHVLDPRSGVVTALPGTAAQPRAAHAQLP